MVSSEASFKPWRGGANQVGALSLKVSVKPHWTGQRTSSRTTVVKNSKGENDQQDPPVHISSWGQDQTQKVGELHLQIGPLSKSSGALAPVLGYSSLEGLTPLVKALRASSRRGLETRPRTQTGRGAWTRVPRVGEKGGQQGRGSPGDWQQLWAGREGWGGVNLYT